MPDYGYEDVDDIECDPGVDVDDLFNHSLGFVCEVRYYFHVSIN